MLTFKDCHNTFSTAADLRSPLACLGLCKHVSLLLQHRKGHRRVSFVCMAGFFKAFLEAETKVDSYGRMHEWAFSAMNAINVTLVLLFSAFPLKKNQNPAGK